VARHHRPPILSIYLLHVLITTNFINDLLTALSSSNPSHLRCSACRSLESIFTVHNELMNSYSRIPATMVRMKCVPLLVDAYHCHGGRHHSGARDAETSVKVDLLTNIKCRTVGTLDFPFLRSIRPLVASRSQLGPYYLGWITPSDPKHCGCRPSDWSIRCRRARLNWGPWTRQSPGAILSSIVQSVHRDLPLPLGAQLPPDRPLLFSRISVEGLSGSHQRRLVTQDSPVRASLSVIMSLTHLSLVSGITGICTNATPTRLRESLVAGRVVHH
jgi:hypothetical protein